MLAVLGLAAGAAAASARADENALWQALGTPGHFAMIRHALAPGTGDPPSFRIDDCSTQRNLSDAGRAQARRIGDRFRRHGIAAALVYSSQWCRCMETARLLDLGEARPQPVLNSFFSRPDRASPQTRELRAWLASRTDRTPLVLVTHQVNITELTGVYPASGELVVVQRLPDERVRVVGTIRTD